MPGKKNKKRPSSYERSNKSADNLQKFAKMMYDIITKAKSKNWKQGWLGVKGTILGLPQNISGRTYSGGNSFFLMADTSEKGYNTPVYMTFKQAKDRNLHVNAGEKSVPIFKWGLSIKDENGKTVSEEDYNAMPKEERDKLSVRPYPKVYHVFNIDQTNLSEVNKKKYDTIVARFKAPEEEVKDSKGMYINDALDRMFKEKAWHCDIRYNKPSSRAFYVPSQDFIVLPMKEQFKIGKTAEEVYRDGMEYYSTALHEMAHSTGHTSRLNRQFEAKRTEGYAHEELIAEMTAALVGSTMGFDKKILENNANYLKGWLENLKRNPESITTIMSDVGKASDMIIEKVDEQRIALNQTPLKAGNLEGLDEELSETKTTVTEQQETSPALSEEEEAERYSQGMLSDFEFFRNESDATNRTVLDKENYDAEYLYVPLLLDGKPSNLAITSDSADYILSNKVNLAVYNYGNDKNADQSINWQKWIDLSEEYNATAPKELQCHEDGDTPQLAFFSVEAAIKFNDWVQIRLQQKEEVNVPGTNQTEAAQNESSLFEELNKSNNKATVSEVENDAAYGNISKLEYIQLIPLEGMKEKYWDYCDLNKIDSQKEESAVAFLDYVKKNNLSSEWWPETFQTEDVAENASLSEDSNPETNVASIAKNIMEKGNVPKEVAEKQATVIADAQQAAIEEKKQKAEQAKQAALKKAEDERRREVEEEKRREEENKQQEKDSGPSSKLLLHAALLLGALELAKGNKGIWMNKAGKSNAEFIGTKRPIMAYNNIMMNLQSDKQGYRSNVYTTYDSAKDAGTAVKQNEESLAFNWIKWDYQHVGTKELISREDYDKLPAEEKEFYTKHKSKEEYGIFNIDQTTMPAGKQADYTALLKDKGAKIDQLTERGVSSMMKFAEKLKSNHPTSMVIARTDSKYQIYGKDASRAGKLLNLPVSQTEENGQKVKSVSFPLDRINDYLPKLVEAKQWVVVAENLDSAELIRQLPNEKEVISKANQTAQRVAKSAGIGYERVMVLQDAAYDKQADKIIVSGMSNKDAGDSRQTALQKANDIYRAVVAATGSEHRLDRMGRNNLLPGDDAKYERFVQDLAAGVLMARQGLPATLSKESMQNVDYLQREIRENPKMLGLIEKDVNNAIESIDKHIKKEIVNYEDIRKELTPKDLIVSPKQYKISSDLAKIPDIDSKQIVIVRDKAKGAADVILPEGASLDDDVEISGIRKDRIKIALGKEGISDVKFYNAGGGLGLNETNDYYKGKEVSVDKLKQYEFSQHRDIDVKPQIEAAKVANIKLFTPIKDDKGQYAFFFKVDNEPSFAVYPNEAHKRAYFDARNTDQKKEIHEALAQKYYSVAQKHPEIKVDLIMPKVPAVDMSKIERPTITKDRDDPNKKYVMATIDGKLMKEPISKEQWNKMWLADDMAEYKKAVAAVTFAPFLKVEEKNENPIKQEKQETVSSNQEQTTSQSEDTNEEDIQQEGTTPKIAKPRGMGIG
jgi:antirestriction protein ArdC